MENSMNEKAIAVVNFQLYLNLIKDNTITWEFFTQIMKDFVNNDLEKLKKLNFYMIKELKEFKYQEAEKFKLQKSAFIIS